MPLAPFMQSGYPAGIAADAWLPGSCTFSKTDAWQSCHCLVIYPATALFPDVSREDALALSRLYAVQLLGGLCLDFQAAADWLQAGGAGLSEEQQEVGSSTYCLGASEQKKQGIGLSSLQPGRANIKQQQLLA